VASYCIADVCFGLRQCAAGRCTARKVRHISAPVLLPSTAALKGYCVFNHGSISTRPVGRYCRAIPSECPCCCASIPLRFQVSHHGRNAFRLLLTVERPLWRSFSLRPVHYNTAKLTWLSPPSNNCSHARQLPPESKFDRPRMPCHTSCLPLPPEPQPQGDVSRLLALPQSQR
jgi:hypothetical protein